MSPELTREQFELVQSQLLTIGRLVRDMPLAAFIAQIDRADTVGPFVDPTAYRFGQGHLDLLRKMATTMQGFQKALPTLGQALELDANSAAYRRVRDDGGG